MYVLEKKYKKRNVLYIYIYIFVFINKNKKMEDIEQTIVTNLPTELWSKIFKDTNNSNIEQVLMKMPQSFLVCWEYLEQVAIDRHGIEQWKEFKERHWDEYLKTWIDRINQIAYKKGVKSFIAPLSIFEISLKVNVIRGINLTFINNENKPIFTMICSKRNNDITCLIYRLAVNKYIFITANTIIKSYGGTMKDIKTLPIDLVKSGKPLYFSCKLYNLERLMFYIVETFELRVTITETPEGGDNLINSCVTCGIPSNQKCSGSCGTNTVYCGIECQTKDWENHKHICF